MRANIRRVQTDRERVSPGESRDTGPWIYKICQEAETVRLCADIRWIDYTTFAGSFDSRPGGRVCPLARQCERESL